MKRFIFATLFLLAMLGTANAQAATGTATKVTFPWVDAVYPAGTPNCSATITTNCALGYTETITGPSGVLATIPACTATVTTGCIGPTATTYTWTSPTALAYGSYSVSLVTNAIGATATPVLSSVPLTASAVYSPSITVAPAPGGVVGSGITLN